MINGTFDVAVDTPKYHRRGTLAMKSTNDVLDARLSIAGGEDFDFTGTCIGKEVEFESSGEFGVLGHVDYHAKGEVWGNSVDISCDSSVGKITVFGTRLSASAGDLRSSHEFMMKASTGEFDKDDSTMYSGLYADGG